MASKYDGLARHHHSIGALGIIQLDRLCGYRHQHTSGMVVAIVVSLVAMVADFILTLITYRDEPGARSSDPPAFLLVPAARPGCRVAPAFS